MSRDCVLVATSRALLLVDLASGDRWVLDQSRGLYYGVTWDHTHIFVATRWYPAWMPTSAIERPRLLIYDHSWRQVDMIELPIDAGGLHQIYFSQGALYCSCSRQDAFVIIEGGSFRHWFPSDDPSHHGRDVHHFNSIWRERDDLYLIAHNNGRPSEIWRAEWPGLVVAEKISIGHQAHNVWREGAHLATCSSGSGSVVTLDGRRLGVQGGFPRGVATRDDIKIVGSSAVANRSNRWLSRGRLHVYDRNWDLEQEIDLGLCGQVNEVRLLRDDDSHNGLGCPAPAPARMGRIRRYSSAVGADLFVP
ncbi:MAG: hypothetical protein MI919_24675 [Holophagales bacterium]|nr:hypothetical protein [Holophagales bacterium]